MMKKILLCILAVLILCSLVSCNAYTDAQANEIIDELLVREAELNSYIYGNAFQTKEDPGEDVDATTQRYYEVREDSKYLTITSLKQAVDDLIVSTSREGIYGYAFDGTNDEYGSRPPRFRENSTSKNIDINVADNDYKLTTVALLGSAKVSRSNKTHIRADITVYRCKSDGSFEKASKEVEIRMENGVWKLIDQTMIGGTCETPPTN
ncbi:MAG: hypothetical protein IKM34_04895 [Clostridia bacterium]|nr:hypothetical protein [Clostridia bacterium]